MKALAIVTIIALLTACTYNISMAHTEGTATDTIDDTTSQQPNISPTITALPGAPL